MFEFSFNFDLLTVGIAVAGTGLLGFAVYFSNRKSITNVMFFVFSLVTLAWGVANYLNYQIQSDFLVLWTIRIVICLAVLQALSFFTLMYVFPQETVILPRWFKFILIPFSIFVALLTLTPFVFSSITRIPGELVSHPVPAPGIIVFVLTAVFLVLGGFFVILKKLNAAKNKLRSQIKLIVIGVSFMFTAIILFNLVFTIIFNTTRYIPLGALFTLPFVIFTAIAILKQHLFNVKVAGTAVASFFLAVFTFTEVVFSNSTGTLIFRSIIFILVLTFSILLIRSVLREVYQRERLQKLTIQLENANEKLKGLDKLKTEFISLASHQLRSPLTAIKGYASMLLEGSFKPLEVPEQKTAIERIFQSSMNLARVVEDLLDVSKIEQGGMKYEMSSIDIKKLAKDIADELKVTAKNKGLQLDFEEKDLGGYVVKADPVKIRQAILNLVDNSIKYTQSGFVKVVVTKPSVGKLRISIIDSGMGISEENMGKLFEKFSRGDGGKVNAGGSGLGLYLVKEIVEAHSGKVWAESQGVGKGSTFIVELPEVAEAEHSS